jgi:hypothetical protein
MNEIFLPIKGFETKYEISNLGRVMSKNKDGKTKILKNYLGNRGYYTVHLGRKSRSNLVHRLVAEHFIENNAPEKLIHVNHLNGDKACNVSQNLEWCDRSGNITHAFSCGLIPSGEKSRFAKLSNKDVRSIFEIHETGNAKQYEIAKSFGVHPSQISKIINSKQRKYG